jgi:hypothetical protein
MPNALLQVPDGAGRIGLSADMMKRFPAFALPSNAGVGRGQAFIWIVERPDPGIAVYGFLLL